jgi:hypothetical protein
MSWKERTVSLWGTIGLPFFFEIREDSQTTLEEEFSELSGPQWKS